MPRNAVFFEERKFLWDGRAHETGAQARETAASYAKDGFETRVIEEDGQHLVYSRRVAAQQAAAGN